MIEFDQKDLSHFDGKRSSKATGIEVLNSTDTTVSLWQRNSKGNLSRCFLTVPKDKIGELIAELGKHA